jgi:hypothetical protein
MIKDFDSYKRNGKVLTSYSILKQDYRLEKTLRSLFPQIVGMPNFYGAENLYSFGQPTIRGLESVLNAFSRAEYVWMNLREEPIMYLNSKPFVLRDVSTPFTNISSFRGISSENIEELEKRLKADIVEEAGRNDGFICVHEEVCHEQLVESFMTADSIMTAREVSHLMLSRGYSIQYFRVPLSSLGFVSETSNLNEIIQILGQNMNRDAVFLFNSSTGSSRSIFTLVFASLFLFKSGALTLPNLESSSGVSSSRESSRAMIDYCTDKRRLCLCSSPLVEKIEREIPNLEELFEKWDGENEDLVFILGLCLDGKYRMLNNIMGIIDRRSKMYVDYLIDKFSGIVNLRKAILSKCLDAFLSGAETNEPILAIEKYATLILFAEYFFHRPNSQDTDFVTWLNSSGIFHNLFKYLKSKRYTSNVFFPINLLTKGLGLKKSIRGIISNRYTLLFETKGSNPAVLDGRISKMQLPVPREGQRRIWIDLREEPCVYISGRLFILRELINYTRNATHLIGISPEDLENLEERLKSSIIAELLETGKILKYRHTNEDIEEEELSGQDVGVRDIVTPLEYFSSIGYRKNEEYFRIPVTDNHPMTLKTFDKLLEICMRFPDVQFMVQSDGVGNRSTYASIIIDLVLGADSGSIPEEIRFKPIHSLVRVLKHGKDCFWRINHLHLKHIGGSANKLSFDLYDRREVLNGLKMYCLLICFDSYLRGDRGAAFEEFFNSKEELLAIYRSIDEMPDEELLLETASEITENFNHIKGRSGKVLGSMTILKHDYFIGSNVFSLDDPVENTQNFRYIHEGGIIFGGLAMPTALGVKNALERLRRVHGSGDLRVAWFCLREEPVVYINDNPYALRYVTQLTENIVTKGISCGVVEDVEDDLVADVLAEAREMRILVHDEVKYRDKTETIGSIQSIRKVTSVKAFFESFDFRYFRVAITDEQAPIPAVFDLFCKIIRSCTETNVLMFSCQMGRGRTTVAMIVSYLIMNASSLSLSGVTMRPAKYKIISKLLQILPNAAKAKMLADCVIDKFDHLENLRNAIDRYTAGSYSVIKRGKDFLLRYFYLIVFCEYLLQNRKDAFAEFLRRNPEVLSLADETDFIGLQVV